MKKQSYDVVIIGGSAAGLVAAMTTKSFYSNKSVLVIRKEEKVMIPCGIPYIFGTLGTSDKNILPDGGLIKSGVEIKVAEVTKINKDEHDLVLKNGEIIGYDKLVIATGSKPYVPKFITGTNLKNVFTIPKNKDYLDVLNNELKGLKKIAVIGAGFIGVELSDELVKNGKEVSLIEVEDHILEAAFDEEASVIAEEMLINRGVNLINCAKVTAINGSNKVESISFEDGKTLDFDAVILSIGYRPNTRLAKESGISVNDMGFIKCDTYMRTHQEDIYTAGDCAQKRDFITGRLTPVMLASTACAEARVAAMNLFELSTIKTFNGTISIYSTSIGDTAFGVAGVTEKRAIKEGFKINVGSFKGMDRHPGVLNNGHYQLVKLVASKNCGLIMGGEVIGGVSAGELTNVLGFIIQNKMTISDLLCSQIGTQPMLTASPAAYPIIKAAEAIAKQMMK
ncbi:pyridine nucleotide-disulfide oxidoreductase [Candidatus Izimaplasma bacterium ZiA1]|uniref:FAD-dependent oxidoreductase n=1 Tax=Candidatus Izimoplasma sp. ZiA1 TaxID=2024899 RepID=UPI000BAA4914|nr:pyridine nucleotide-disulfide oxidoreductase [Candidatus Izimaplasma bacterium ZiA1]